MSKTVLLIESDTTFAREMSAALEAKGFGVRVSSDGREGVELARALHPDCVVLCVELPGLSGYSWCNRLKKDEKLKSIPLVITSSEATPETFEQHRKLKTRAEDYLIKPFPPATLVERVGALVGMPEASEEEDLVTLADVELDGAGGGGGGGGARRVEEDADLRMLDDAFDSISGGGGSDEPSTRAPGAPVAEPPLTLLPDADESPAMLDLDREMAEALASLAEEAAAPARAAPLAASSARPSVRLVEPTVEPAAVDDETPILMEDVEVLPTIDVTNESTLAALRASQEEARALREEVDRIKGVAAGWENAVGSRDHELLSTRSRLEGAEESLRKLGSNVEADREALRIAHERSSELERELGALRPHLAESEKAASARGAEAIEAVDRAEALERALEEARSELAVVQADAETLRAEADALRSESENLRAEGTNLRSGVDAGRVAAESLRAESDALRSAVETLRAEGDALRSETETLRAEGVNLRSEVETLRADGDALRSEAETLRAEGVNLRAEVVHLRDEVAGLRAAAEKQGAEGAAFRAETQAFRAAAAAFRAEAEARTSALAQRLQEMEGHAAEHEDRVLRAHQKIKSDEKLREKTRKALAMVLQVLEERSPGDGSAPPATPER